jgi:photosystem II stability/assembly factor-like uncharacterized protein
MNRVVRVAALVAALALMTSCQAFSKTASTTPGPVSKQGSKGPVLSGQVPSNSSKCAVGATNEPLESYWPPTMTSEATGWGIGQCTLAAQPSFPNGSTITCHTGLDNWMGILRTNDGGATWTDVSPPSVPNRTWHHAQFFLDANHGWVTEVSRTADACASQATTFMTSDGGRTWQQGGSVALKLSAPEDDVFNVSGPVNNMDFIDQKHGWLTVVSPPSHPTGGPGDMTMLTMVYSTADGGMHWALMATNPGKALLGASGCPTNFYAPVSDVSFVSDTSGWLAIACTPGLLMLATRDAGATWSARPLPACSCNVYQPHVLDAGHLVVTGQQGSPVMLTTADGGATWTQRHVPQAAMTGFSFADPSRGWMVGIAQLPNSYETVVYRTVDGGQSWSLVGKPGFATVASNPKAYFPISGVQFLNDTTGFVTLGAEAGTNGQTDPGAPILQILKTGDGGRTWNTVLKQVPATPCSGMYREPFNGPVDVWPVKVASATTAWARGGLRTSDGGAHWKDVSSTALREGTVTALYPPNFADFYLDGDHAWEAAIYGSKTTCSDHVTVFATADGGQTWQPSGSIALNLPSGNFADALQLGFTSAQSGWLFVPRSESNDMMAPQLTAAALYSTSDGGLTWRHVADLGDSQLKNISTPADSQNCKPMLGQITFSSATVGWLSLNCADPAMLVTRDGGLTWKPASTSFGGALPTFVDANHGLVESYGGKIAGPSLLATSDGGATWQPLPPLPSTGYIMATSYVDASNLFALLTPPGWSKGTGGKDWLYRSGDGGQSWQLVQKDVPLGRVNGFAFANASAGMVAEPRNATWSFETAGFADANDTVMATTTDGGHTWKVFKPAIAS